VGRGVLRFILISFGSSIMVCPLVFSDS